MNVSFLPISAEGNENICFIDSARCTNTVTMDFFPKLAKFPGLLIPNISFSTGNFPSALKTANVIPIFKKMITLSTVTIVLFQCCLILAKLLMYT